MSKPVRRVYEFGPFRLDSAERLLLRDGEPISVTPKVFDTLLVLVENGGHLVEKDELMKRLWPDTFVEEVTLARNISDLRKALGEGANEQKYIATIPKRGYRFVASVDEISDELIVEKATRSRLVIEEEETMTDDEAHAEKAAMASAIPPHFAAPSTHAHEGDSQSQSPGVTSSGVHRLQLDVRRYKRRYLLSFGALVVLVVVVVSFTRFMRLTVAPASRAHTATFKRLTYDSKSDYPAISADGKNLAYVVWEKNQSSIWLKNLANDSAVQVTQPTPNPIGALVFSPDSNQLYYLAWHSLKTGTLCRIPVFGGTSQTLINDVFGFFALSPNGNQAVFTRLIMPQAETHIVIADIDGSGERNVFTATDDLGLQLYGSKQAWSPDGQRIAAGGWRREQNDSRAVLFEIQVSDGTVKEIPTPRWSVIKEVAWLSDNSGFIVTVEEKPASPPQIWQVAASGGEAWRLTNDANFYGAISLTADSRTLVARQLIDLIHVWIAPECDASRAHQLTFGANRDDGFNGLFWTPDGKIVFTSTTDGESDIWIMDSDGSNRKQLTTRTGGANESPRVTSDGRYIVFSSSRTGQLTIWRMDADGNNPRQISDGEYDNSPALSPDGLWVYYGAFTRDDASPISLRRVSIEGGESVRVPAKYCIGSRVAISPDGKLIAYPYRRGQAGGIAIAHVEDGERVSFLENVPAERGISRFTPDSEAIVYMNNGSTVGNLWRQPLDGSPPQQLTHFAEHFVGNFALSADGHQLALSRGQHFIDIVSIKDFK